MKKFICLYKKKKMNISGIVKRLDVGNKSGKIYFWISVREYFLIGHRKRKNIIEKYAHLIRYVNFF